MSIVRTLICVGIAVVLGAIALIVASIMGSVTAECGLTVVAFGVLSIYLAVVDDVFNFSFMDGLVGRIIRGILLGGIIIVSAIVLIAFRMTAKMTAHGVQRVITDIFLFACVALLAQHYIASKAEDLEESMEFGWRYNVLSLIFGILMSIICFFLPYGVEMFIAMGMLGLLVVCFILFAPPYWEGGGFLDGVREWLADFIEPFVDFLMDISGMY